MGSQPYTLTFEYRYTVGNGDGIMIINKCPYCEVQVEGRRYEKVNLVREPDSPIRSVQETGSMPEHKTHSSECHVVLEPCEHSFPRDSLRMVESKLSDVQELEHSLHTEESAYYRKIIAFDLKEEQTKLQARIEKANSMVQNTK